MKKTHFLIIIILMFFSSTVMAIETITTKELYSHCQTYLSVTSRDEIKGTTPEEFKSVNQCVLIAEGAANTALVFYLKQGGKKEIGLSPDALITRFVQDLSKLNKTNPIFNGRGSTTMGAIASNIIDENLY